VARASIAHGLRHNKALAIKPENYPLKLQEQRACFVTLTLHGKLRGCIGSLQPHCPLVVDVARNAYAAAFRDLRFLPLRPEEFENLAIRLSLLSNLETMTFLSEQDLVDQLRPGWDGVVLEEGNYRGTFLPAVWESISDRWEFLRQLKKKAGLPPDYWSDTVRIQRYWTESAP
jgi:uncharacterized protein, PH0010 family